MIEVGQLEKDTQTVIDSIVAHRNEILQIVCIVIRKNGMPEILQSSQGQTLILASGICQAEFTRLWLAED